MINEIIDAISIALDNEFGDGYVIHKEEIKQDLKEPCFFVQLIDQSVSPLCGQRYLQNNAFCIQYFPESKLNPYAECNDVAERMMFALEYVTPLDADRAIRGTNKNHDLVDGVLNFFVNYNRVILKKPVRSEVMGQIKIQSEMKGE